MTDGFDFQRPISKWLLRIGALLDHHLVHFVGTKDLWLIQMNHPEDHKVHAFVAPMVAELPTPAKVTVKFQLWAEVG